MLLSQPWIIAIALISAILFQTTCSADSYSKEEDRIISLPGQPRADFKQYAGYITVDEKRQRRLFYYFVEAQSKPDSKPLVLWLNGGPGCSSVGAGAFSEHGPFRPKGGDVLVKNYYGWNKVANMLYLESPAGVGFSYSADKSFYNSVNDDITAQDNLLFLQKWFVKFPEYKNRNLFITGESYAGHYVPQLAQLILQSRLKFNLKGIALGNPLLDFSTDINSEGDFYWSHGLISDSTYSLQKALCNTSRFVREGISGNISAACSFVNKQLSDEVSSGIDTHAVTSDICISYPQSQLNYFEHPLQPRFRILSSLRSVIEPKENIDSCVEEKTIDYLNKRNVQEALHAQLVGTTNWTFCSSVLHYEMKNLEIPMKNVLGSLVSSGIHVLVYSGDQDAVIPFTATRTTINELAKELGLHTSISYRPWFVDKQVAGWTQVYGETLTFTTIRGGSHMAPFSSPRRSLALFSAFLTEKQLIA